MKNSIISLFILLGLFFILFIGLKSYFCKLGCKHCTKTSKNSKESKSNGFYIGSYTPSKLSFSLINHKQTIQIKKVWVESKWFDSSKSCFKKKYEKREGCNVFVEIEIDNIDTKLFTLTPIVSVKIHNPTMTNKGLSFGTLNLPDTIQLQVYEKNPLESGWNNKIEGELLTFILQI